MKLRVEAIVHDQGTFVVKLVNPNLDSNVRAISVRLASGPPPRIGTMTSIEAFYD